MLGYETSIPLGILKIGYDAESVNAIETIEPFGKIKGVMVNIPIKPNAKGVVQAYRRVPVPLEKLVDSKIKELLRQGIIEKVDGVSPMVVIPKGDNDVRICLDMRRANLAIERENHPLPLMDVFLPHLGEAKIFSKLDIQQAFHQVEISPESREMTFMTRKRLFRYTRLLFGITCAPEIFQKIMEMMLSGCDGVIIFMDDVLIHAPTMEFHDLRLKEVLDRFRKFGVKLNKDKCIFGAKEIEFCGHRLSEAGIKPIHDHLEAVSKFREPKNAEEVRSFLGLVNYVGKFIPDL